MQDTVKFICYQDQFNNQIVFSKFVFCQIDYIERTRIH